MARSKAFTVIGFVPTPTLTSVVATGGVGTSYTYKIVGVDAAGAQTAASAGVTQASGPTTLDVTHYNTCNWTDPLNAVSILIYRTAGGATQGLVGTVAAGVQTFRDDGKVADGSTASASNVTGFSAAIPTADLRDLTLAVAGTFVASWKLQGTHTPLGAWVDLSLITAAGTSSASAQTTPLVVATLAPAVGKVRFAMTAYTSGTVTASIAGH
jgi:hypothetical protein